ncbi:MAG: hypothetical protein RL637_298 [Pseudomonadota bacterium]|jgi:D-sedoheptulose 7-phosphate isomerase
MNLTERVIDLFNHSIETKKQSLDLLANPICITAELIAQRLSTKSRIFTCGNGGSAGDAQHFASEMLNRFERERPPLPVITLTSDTLTITSIANDYHYDQVFAKPLKGLANAGDILMVYTTSGQSANVVQAVLAAQQLSMTVIAFTGKTGGEVAQLLTTNDIELRVPSNSTARIQEVHLLITHCLCDLIDRQLFPEIDQK